MKEERINILVIEDNPDDIRIMKRRLAKYHFDIDFATSGEEGLEKLKKKYYDIVIADYAMPGMTGLDILDKMNQEGYDIPLVMVTGAGSERVAVEAIKMGAYDYVVKDMAYIDSLNIVINRVLKRYEIEKEREELKEHLLQKTTELEKVNRRLKRLSITDDLTGVYNRRFMFERFEEECGRTDRYSFLFSGVIIDLDFFKAINDKFGHLFGDFVMKKVASIIKKSLRKVDILGRYGGDEFIILLPMTDEKNAYVLAERIRKLIEAQVFQKGKKSVRVTASIGIASCPSERVRINNRRQLIEAADRALYKAKSDGRNRTELV